MALREFIDEHGVQWRVWDTHPGTTEGDDSSALSRFMHSQPAPRGQQPSTVRPEFQSGWLTFTQGDRRQRLAPIPSGWERRDQTGLRELLSRSKVTEPPQRLR